MSMKQQNRAGPVDPLRPSDHMEGDAEISSPVLGIRGWARWGWRQLTSMRTALVLLLFLAIAAVPGSLFPQRGADPNGVIQWERNNPDLFPIADSFGLFDVYTAPWFSAIYLLLFISLVGCVIPRTRHHLTALRAKPPRTPARLSRLAGYREIAIEPDRAAFDVSGALDVAERQLERAGYRVQRYGDSVSAERGYARETGNLVFHVALVGVLVSVGVGTVVTYTGQRVVVEGTTFVNQLSDYSSFTPGRAIDGTELQPYSLTLDDFRVSYQLPGDPGAGQAGDFSADVTVREPGAAERSQSILVNYPITVAGDRIFLLGNGYAPTLTIRNPDGEVVWSESQPFLPQDGNMTSLGIIKVPDGLPEQLGLVGFFYPTRGVLASGAFTSIYPEVVDPVLTLNVFSGDLGIDDGTPRSVYQLEVDGLTQHTGGDTGVDSLEMTLGQTVDLPNGWGTVTWEIAPGDEPVKRFASLQIQRDPTSGWVLGFAILACFGLFAGLLVPRRRLWVRAHDDAGGLRIEYAGLARGEDPALVRAVGDFASRHSAAVSTPRAEGGSAT